MTHRVFEAAEQDASRVYNSNIWLYGSRPERYISRADK